VTDNRALKRAIRQRMQETGEKYTEARRAVLQGTGAGQRSSMFNRFTERAKQVVVLAQEEARNLKHEHVGGEHILLGLLREEEGLAARVLESLDMGVEAVRAQVVRVVGSGQQVTSGDIAFAPEARKALERSLREALLLGHNYIGTEHLLLGLVRENEGVAACILTDLQTDAATVRNEVIRMLAGPGGGSRTGRDLPGIPIPDGLLDWAGEPLRRLEREVEKGLGRPADAGDLLVLLACVQDGLAARTLAALGVDAERLARAAEKSRRGGTRSKLAPRATVRAECDEIRAEKEAAIEAHFFQRAARLRDRERELIRKAGEVVDEGPIDELLAEARRRLGLTAE